MQIGTVAWLMKFPITLKNEKKLKSRWERLFFLFLINCTFSIHCLIFTSEDNYFQIFPLNERIENINDQYWTLRAEEVSWTFCWLVIFPHALFLYMYTYVNSIRIILKRDKFILCKATIQQQLLVHFHRMSLICMIIW